MRVGVVLPTFQRSAGLAFEVARRAEELGVDAVFSFDHVWPLGRPDRPAIAPFPLLGAIASSSDVLGVGTLVARIGLVPDEALLAEFAALATLAPGRVVAGLGTGDHLSAAENDAYGVPPAPPEERRAALRRCARALRDAGITVWVGGGHRRTIAVAEEEHVAVNLWGASPERVAEQARRCEVTWGGPAPPLEPDVLADAGREEAERRSLRQLLGELSTAGATWAVFAWPVSLEALVEGARAIGPG